MDTDHVQSLNLARKLREGGAHETPPIFADRLGVIVAGRTKNTSRPISLGALRLVRPRASTGQQPVTLKGQGHKINLFFFFT